MRGADAGGDSPLCAPLDARQWPDYHGLGRGRPSVPGIHLKIVSYNIRKVKGIRGSRPTLEEIARHLGSLEPDLLLCQEVFHGQNGVHQSGAMAERLELLHRYEPNAEYRRGHHGNATFSRFPISRHQNRDISTNRVEKRGILYTRVHPFTGGILHVFNTHLGLNHKQRRNQVRSVSIMLDELVCPGEPVILAGDFNDWNGQLDREIAERCGLENAMLLLTMHERRTWSTRRPLFALDRVYYRDLQLQDVKVLSTPPWDRLSDHFPIQVQLEAPTPARGAG